MTDAVLNRESVTIAARLLRGTVIEPWESVDQVIEEAARDRTDLGDPLTEGTAGWHLRHIVEIFRLHARTVMEGVGDTAAAATITPPDAPIPTDGRWSPRSVRDDLLRDVDTFCGWLLRQPDGVLARPFAYGRPVDATTMLSVMIQHITWHAAAVHYWMKWRSGPR